MKVESKIDLTPIVVALILSVAAVSVAKIVAPRRYVPIGAAPIPDGRGFYLDTETGRANFGP